MPKNKNPISKEDKIAQRIEPDIESDAYGEVEQKRVVEMVKQDAEADTKVMDRWLTDKKLDLQHLDGAKPSVLENLTKETWMSDRNMGLCAAINDTYHTTLLATCWNPDTIHFKATEKNDIDNKHNLEGFSKWMVGPNECDVRPEVDDYVANKTSQGFGMFKLGWKVWYEWIDKRIPKKTGGYTIKTEKKRFERGFMENIPNLEDVLLPRYGKKLQTLPHMIHIVHLYGHELLDLGKRGIYLNVTDKWVENAKENCLAKKKEGLEDEKADELGLANVSDEELRSLPVDIHEWYGIYKKNGKVEKYRFVVDIASETFLSGKPLRKITRTGKYPFVGGAFIKKPGQIKGKSLPRLIINIVNAFNNIWNQKSDFQYVENCPFGFIEPDENYQKQEYKIEPLVLFPTANAQSINIPNLSRSMAWADNDFKTLFELLEKITGAASYFQTTERNSSGTATRDKLVAQHSQTRFGGWVANIQSEIAEGITMLVSFYQDNAPPKLGVRVLGEGGRELIRNLSVDSLRGNYDAYMSPDVSAGSKAYEKEIAIWGFENLQQSPWLHPSINPKGSWLFTRDSMKKIGFASPDRYLPPEPKPELGSSQDIKDEWARFMQGDVFDPSPMDNVMEHLKGHSKQKEEQLHELDEEYRANFDKHLFKTYLQADQMMRKVQQEQMADKLAMRMIGERESGVNGEGTPGQPPATRTPGMGGAAEQRKPTQPI